MNDCSLIKRFLFCFIGIMTIGVSRRFIFLPRLLVRSCHSMTYIQGQSPEPKIREYFYYMDHQGMLFMDDSKMKNFTSCFKDKQFLKFFISRITHNNTGETVKSIASKCRCSRRSKIRGRICHIINVISE